MLQTADADLAVEHARQLFDALIALQVLMMGVWMGVDVPKFAKFDTHKDHIGSIDTITEGDDNGMTGQITQAMSFGAWGERRDAEGWTDQFMGSTLSILRNITPRGFTGHEKMVWNHFSRQPRKG